MPKTTKHLLSTKSHRPLPGPFILKRGDIDEPHVVDVVCQQTGIVIVSHPYRQTADAITCANLIADALNYYRVQPALRVTTRRPSCFTYAASEIGPWGVDLFYLTPSANIYIATVDQFDTACKSILVAQWIVDALNTLGREPGLNDDSEGFANMLFPSLGNGFA
ncbi:MAG: hypothetical protein AAFX06_33590 [Planctomycetota bacterium]